MKKLNLLGWVLIIFILYMVAKTNEGYRVIYMALFLIFAYLLVYNYKSIEAATTITSADPETPVQYA